MAGLIIPSSELVMPRLGDIVEFETRRFNCLRKLITEKHIGIISDHEGPDLDNDPIETLSIEGYSASYENHPAPIPFSVLVPGNEIRDISGLLMGMKILLHYSFPGEDPDHVCIPGYFAGEGFFGIKLATRIVLNSQELKGRHTYPANSALDIFEMKEYGGNA